MPELSVIIVNFRSWRSLRQCLDSLSAIPQDHISFEVIIVDNASADGMFEKFRAEYPDYNFLLNSGNNGFANGCNLGTTKAEGGYLLFLNPDTVANEQALVGMLNMARTNAINSIISCLQVRRDGSEEKPFGRFLSPLTLTGWLRTLKSLYSNDKNTFVSDTGFISPDWVSGSVIMISRESFDGLGGWDEAFWMYFEDVDLCKRARDSGGDIILLKDVTIEHNHGGSTRNSVRISALTKSEVNISRHVYISKHEKGVRKIYIQSLLVINNLITGFFQAVLGIILFFIKSLKIAALTYFSLISYYISALYHGTWLSPRSVNYRN